MADIFISYARPDRERVAPLARALESLGWSVWWDRHIPPGRTFDDVIEEEIEAARAVICVWTPASVESGWVRTEAAEGLSRGILVPVVMGPVSIPLGFRRIQVADLSQWQPEADHPGFHELVEALRDLLGGATDAVLVQPPGLNEDADVIDDNPSNDRQLGSDATMVSQRDQQLEQADRLPAGCWDDRSADERAPSAESETARERPSMAVPPSTDIAQQLSSTVPSETPPAVGREPQQILATPAGSGPRLAAHDRRRRWGTMAAAVLLVSLAAIVLLSILLATGRGDDQGSEPVPSTVGIGRNWFGEPAEAAVPALRERGFTVIDYLVCSGSVGVGEVRQIIDSDDGTIYLDTEGITPAGELVDVDRTIEVKVGSGTPCDSGGD